MKKGEVSPTLKKKKNPRGLAIFSKQQLPTLSNVDFFHVLTFSQVTLECQATF